MNNQRCAGCGLQIDPTTCGCGNPIDHAYDGHLRVPMGCRCYQRAAMAYEAVAALPDEPVKPKVDDRA